MSRNTFMEMTDNMKISLGQIAKTAHYIHLAHCHAMGHKTQPRWKDLDVNHRLVMMSTIVGILGGEIKSVEDSHKNFVESKIADGWKYGEEYSIERKTNPRLTTFDKLSEEDRMKDILFFACIYSFK